MDDYMMSDYYRNAHNNKVLRKMTLIGVSQNVAQPLLEVNETYLQAALDQIAKNYGNMDAFLLKELEIDNSEKDRIKNHILAPKEE